MAEFAYNNIKNTSINYISFKINYKYYFQVFYKKDLNSCFKSKWINKLLVKFWESIVVY